jgi:hypothetical protein
MRSYKNWNHKRNKHAVCENYCLVLKLFLTNWNIKTCHFDWYPIYLIKVWLCAYILVYLQDDTNADSQIVLCCYQAVNVYYYKYTVDGMNVILININWTDTIRLFLFLFEFGFLDNHVHMLPIVIAAILIGFIDKGKIPVVPKLGVSLPIKNILCSKHYTAFQYYLYRSFC